MNLCTSFADDKMEALSKIESVCRRQFQCSSSGIYFHTEENIFGKGENAGNQDFLLFPTLFSKGL